MSDRLNRPGILTLVFAAAMMSAPAARAQLDPPSSGALFGFPGSFATPATPVSAGHALADRWLGDEPWDDPAAGGGRSTIQGAMLYLREDRQDLRAENRQFDGGGGSIDFGSAALGVPLPGKLTGWLYTYRPEVRSEDVAFYLGSGTDPLQPSALVTAQTLSKEARSGVGLSRGFGAMRLGLAIELTQRSDEWTRTLQSGAPESGTRHTQWDGTATGAQLGFRWTRGDSAARSLTIGGGLRMIPELQVSGNNDTELLTGSSDSSVTTTRQSGWEGGLSAAYRITPEVRVLAGAGMRTAMDWSGLGLTSGRWSNGALAFDYHDPETPWTIRAGYALDQQDEVAESHAGTLGLSFGWDFGGGTVVELGGIHRSIHRSGEPSAYQDRVLLGFHLTL